YLPDCTHPAPAISTPSFCLPQRQEGGRQSDAIRRYGRNEPAPVRDRLFPLSPDTPHDGTISRPTERGTPPLPDVPECSSVSDNTSPPLPEASGISARTGPSRRPAPFPGGSPPLRKVAVRRMEEKRLHDADRRSPTPRVPVSTDHLFPFSCIGIIPTTS